MKGAQGQRSAKCSLRNGCLPRPDLVRRRRRLPPARRHTCHRIALYCRPARVVERHCSWLTASFSQRQTELKDSEPNQSDGFQWVIPITADLRTCPSLTREFQTCVERRVGRVCPSKRIVPPKAGASTPWPPQSACHANTTRHSITGSGRRRRSPRPRLLSSRRWTSRATSPSSSHLTCA